MGAYLALDRYWELSLFLFADQHRRRDGTDSGNAADDGVEKYRYDYVFYNDHPLSETERIFVSFLRRVMQEHE